MNEKISSEEVESLRKQMYEFQMKVDILKETINVLKKDPGVDWKNLKNREKVVRRVMKEERLQVKIRKATKYSSYKGEISPAVPNEVQRKFYSEKPNKLLLSDISEFAIPAGKVYLSPTVDCFDGMLVTWRISEHPNAELVNDMLDDVIANMGTKDKPIIHTDRGCHYRWPGWIKRMK